MVVGGPIRNWLTGLALAVFVGGCGDNVLLIDPPVVFTDAGSSFIGTGDPEIELGIFTEQFFVALEDDGPLPIVSGFQGGTWVMPAIRGRALIGSVRAVGRLEIIETSEVVGVLEDPQARLQPTAEGFTELVALPIPVVHAAPNEMQPIDDLYSKRARLTITMTDTAGRSATSTIEITLIEG